MEAVPLFDLPHVEARRLVATGAPVYLSVNPVEYHGPHLSLHNDRLVSRALAHDLHARLVARGRDWPLLVAEDLEVGVEPCPGPGTRHTRYPATRGLVLEACRALAELGAQRVVLMTFHGAPLHNLALEAGVQDLARRGIRAIAPFHIVMRELVELDPGDPRFEQVLALIPDADERRTMARDLAHDFHAGFFETSVAMHFAPSSVSPVHATLPPCPPIPPDARFRAAARAARSLGRAALARELDFAAVGVGWSALRPFPGYTGRPHLASARAGALFASFLVDAFEPVVDAVLDGTAQPPAPIMAWAGRLSAGGRIGALPRPALSQILQAV